MCSSPPETVFRFNETSDWSHFLNFSTLKFLGASYDDFPVEGAVVSDIARANEIVAIHLTREYGFSFERNEGGDGLHDILREIVIRIQVSFYFIFKLTLRK
jgi:hypothetical protein